MKRMRSLFIVLMVLLCACNGWGYSVSLTPGNQSINGGDAARVDLNLFLNPGEELFGFDFVMAFDPAILRFEDLVFADITANTYNAGFTAPAGIFPSLLTFNGALDLNLAGGLTADIIPLATISFTGINIGTSPLLLTGSVLDFNEANGLVPLAAAASVNVVPEPGTVLLLGVGLVALFSVRKKLRSV